MEAGAWLPGVVPLEVWQLGAWHPGAWPLCQLQVLCFHLVDYLDLPILPELRFPKNNFGLMQP